MSHSAPQKPRSVANHKLKKLLRGFLYVLLLLLLISAGLTSFILTTEKGLNLTIAWLKKSVPHLTIEQANGRLIGPLALEGLSFNTESFIYQQDKLTLDWSISGLLKKTVIVDSLLLNDVVFTLKNSAEESNTNESVPLPDSIQLPFGLNFIVKQFELNRLSIQSSDETYVIDKVSLAIKSDIDQYKIDQLSIDSDWLKMNMSADLEYDSPFAINSHAKIQLDIDRFLSSNYAAIDTAINIEGNINQLSIAQIIRTPYNTKIDLTLNNILENLHFKIETDSQDIMLSAINPSLPENPISTVLSAKGSAKKINIQQLLIKPNTEAEINVKGEASFEGKQPAFDIITTWQKLQWPLTVEDELLFYSQKGELTIAGSVDNMRLNLESIIGDSGRLAGNIVAADILEPARSFDANLNWENITYPLITTDQARYRSDTGSLILNGNYSAYSVDILSDVKTLMTTDNSKNTEWIAADISLSGAGTPTSFSLNQLSIKPEKNSGDSSLNNSSLDDGYLNNSYLMAQGEAEFAEDFSRYMAELSINGDKLNPAIISENWPGELATTLQLSAEKNQQGLSASINELTVKGELRGYPIRAEMDADYIDNMLDIKALSLISGESQLTASGQYNEENIALQWDFASEDLVSLHPDISGSVKANGELSGKPMQPVLQANLNAKSLAFAGNNINEISLQADVDLSAKHTENLINISIDGLNANDLVIDNITAKLNGSVESHQLMLAANSAQGNIEKRLAGQLFLKANDFEWLFSVEQLDITPAQLAPWALHSTTSGSLTAKRVEIEPLCLQSSNNTLCLNTEADFTKQAVNASLTLDQLHYDYIEPLLNTNEPFIVDSGSISGAVTLAMEDNALQTMELALRTEPATLSLPLALNTQNDNSSPLSNLLAAGEEESETTEQWLSFLLARGNIDASLKNNNFSLNVDLPINWQLSDGAITLAELTQTTTANQGVNLAFNTATTDKNKPLLEQMINGRLAINASNLAPVINLFPQFAAETTGENQNLKAAFDISGTGKAPLLAGAFKLENLALTVIDAGITLEDIQANLSTAGNNDLNYQIQARSLSEHSKAIETENELAAGQLSIDGHVSLQSPQSIAMVITGNHFELLNTPEASVIISPSLELKGNQERLDIKGRVFVPYASITPNTLPSSAVTVSSDQIIITETEEPQQNTPDIYADVVIELDDDAVWVESFGFKGNISGAIETKTRPGSPTTGLGELNIINGEYRAYGQGLVIERGRILFSGGNIEQPGIDLKASRNPAPDVVVGILAQGDSQEPDFTLYSEPAMSQTEQLSWLILGKPLNNSTAGEGNALSQLALSIGLSSGDDFLQQFNGQLGVDSISIETGSGEAGAYSDNEQAALTLGKYLTPKLYLSYGIGLFEALNTVKMEYFINRSLKFATESSSAASGGDLIYNIDVK